MRSSLNQNTVLLLAPAFAVFFGLLLSSTAFSQVDTFEFDTEEQQERFRTLSDELRCPMCQNSSLSGSTGGVAEDLRREIHRMIMEGMSDSEIIQFMFERYGDFILFRPRLTAGTVLLWFGPLLFLLIGGLIAFGIWRRARKLSDKESELDQTQQARLQQLLGDKN
ncbi:MAG: cytochrome c [Pseudohongiella sp.]|nr:MAG: cytochrome c [Pseudohongiella sp.]